MVYWKIISESLDTGLIKVTAKWSAGRGVSIVKRCHTSSCIFLHNESSIEQMAQLLRRSANISPLPVHVYFRLNTGILKLFSLSYSAAEFFKTQWQGTDCEERLFYVSPEEEEQLDLKSKCVDVKYCPDDLVNFFDASAKKITWSRKEAISRWTMSLMSSGKEIEDVMSNTFEFTSGETVQGLLKRKPTSNQSTAKEFNKYLPITSPIKNENKVYPNGTLGGAPREKPFITRKYDSGLLPSLSSSGLSDPELTLPDNVRDFMELSKESDYYFLSCNINSQKFVIPFPSSSSARIFARRIAKTSEFSRLVTLQFKDFRGETVSFDMFIGDEALVDKFYSLWSGMTICNYFTESLNVSKEIDVSLDDISRVLNQSKHLARVSSGYSFLRVDG